MFSLLGSLRTASVVLAFATLVSGLGTTCSTSLGAGTSGPNDPFWMESIKHQGKSPFNPNPSSYTVFRNVKDYGAVGDGVHDDTSAINAAITAQGRCGGGSCASSTISPAVVYFPKGTYLISAPIIPYYYTQLIGDAKTPPTLLATASFSGMAVIDADPYIPGGGGAQDWVNQDNFFRSVRNFVIDVRQVPATNSQGTGIHWQVSQATSLMNIVFQMSAASNTAHQVSSCQASGWKTAVVAISYMGDLVFNGGKYGIWGGNQQFTVRNITVNNAQTGVYSSWNWGWTYQGATFNNCQVGFDIATGGITQGTQTTGAMAIIDAVATNTPIFARTSQPSNGALAGSLVLNNVKLNNVPVAVGVVGGTVVLNGGTTTIASWGQGNVFKGTNPTGVFTKAKRKDHPQYAAYSASQFVSVKDHGAVGDGVTDDTAALIDIFNKYSGCNIIFFDAGTYVVTNTVTIPAGTQMVGEAWTVLAGRGGRAIVIEWNVKEPSGVQAGAGMWDSHIRIGGAQEPIYKAINVQAVVPEALRMFWGFFELALDLSIDRVYRGAWAWLADHDLDLAGEGQLTVYSGRGILSESQAEHHAIYQYNIVNAASHYMGLIQTETPYYQPSPVSPSPFSINTTFHDPTPYSGNPSAWALSIVNSHNILVFGAGLYSFFQDYSQTCLNAEACQSQIANIDTASTGVNI
ncbi:pectate lyase superfamily protein-domain-containing protein [Flammula alnicola]|nr:pectate lyase superfamily protein-domain-containing protein [Flammula alnicola]